VVDSAPLAERDFARLAGLGWFGKNTMLIDPRAGSYFLLTAIVTDVALPIDVAVDVDHCGTCTACLDACPTGALPAPRVLDANRCISALTIEHHGAIAESLRTHLGDWIFGCDVCQEVCPWNRHAPGSPDAAFQPRGGEETLDLVEVLALDEAAFRHRFRGSPVLRAKRRGLVRSAAIALGNSPRSAAFAVLARILDDAEAVVRGAAAWALGQWGAAGVEAGPATAALRDRLVVENDADVRREVERALATASRPRTSGDATTGPAG
jgi:epoxyqueuosine reductase